MSCGFGLISLVAIAHCGLSPLPSPARKSPMPKVSNLYTTFPCTNDSFLCFRLWETQFRGELRSLEQNMGWRGALGPLTLFLDVSLRFKM